MEPGFYSHTEYWFEKARVRFYPQDGCIGFWPDGYRLVVTNHADDTLLAINISGSPRPSIKYAKLILETLIK